MLTSGVPLGASSTVGCCAAGALGSAMICACTSALDKVASATLSAAPARSARRVPRARAGPAPLPQRTALSATAMMQPRAALKTRVKALRFMVLLSLV